MSLLYSTLTEYKQLLLNQWAGWRIEVLENVTSTNSCLMERARAGDTEHTILWALQQTKGRGQANKVWHTSEGDFITFSLGLPLTLKSWNGLSLAIGVALAEVLDCIGTQVVIKWPNDLCVWLPDRLAKLGGILIETTDFNLPTSTRYCVIGIGINLDTPKLAVYDNLPPTGCRQWSPQIQAINLMLKILPKIIDALTSFTENGFISWLARYQARDALMGKYLRCADGSTGLYRGIDKDGLLTLEINGMLTSHAQLTYRIL